MRINTLNRLSDEKVPLERGRGELSLSGAAWWVQTLQRPLSQLLPCTSWGAGAPSPTLQLHLAQRIAEMGRCCTGAS